MSRIVLVFARPFAFAAPPLFAQHAHPSATATATAAVPAPKLQGALRGLWHGHVVHAR